MESINKRAAAYPIELLNVMDGQRIPHSQMKASLVSLCPDFVGILYQQVVFRMRR